MVCHDKVSGPKVSADKTYGGYVQANVKKLKAELGMKGKVDIFTLTKAAAAKDATTKEGQARLKKYAINPDDVFDESCRPGKAPVAPKPPKAPKAPAASTLTKDYCYTQSLPNKAAHNLFGADAKFQINDARTMKPYEIGGKPLVYTNPTENADRTITFGKIKFADCTSDD